jgi:hypothetical protein
MYSKSIFRDVLRANGFHIQMKSELLWCCPTCLCCCCCSQLGEWCGKMLLPFECWCGRLLRAVQGVVTVVS